MLFDHSVKNRHEGNPASSVIKLHSNIIATIYQEKINALVIAARQTASKLKGETISKR